MTMPERPDDPSPSPSIDPEAIARVLLGRSTAAEESAVRRLIAADPAARRLAAQLADIRAAMAGEAADEIERAPESLFRDARALAHALPRPPAWFDRMKAALLVPLQDAADRLIDGMSGQPALAPALRGGAAPAIRSFVLDGVRLDVQATESADGRVAILMQLDHAQAGDRALAGDCAVLDHATGAVLAAGSMDESGAARLELGEPPHAVELALRSPLGTFLTGPIKLR